MERMLNLLLLLTLLPLGAALSAITPEEIIRRMEENELHETAYAEGRMITTDKYGTISRSFVSWSMGEEESLIEFTSKGEEGQKILRTADEIYLYFPDAAEILRIQGSAMRDSVMDSDFSYEDMTGDRGLLNDYDATLEGEERIDGNESYKVRLTAKRRSVPYHSQLLWIDKERFVGLKAHKFASSGRLLKELEVLEFEERRDKIIPMRMVMRDTMKKNSSTEFIIDTLDLGISKSSLAPSRPSRHCAAVRKHRAVYHLACFRLTYLEIDLLAVGRQVSFNTPTVSTLSHEWVDRVNALSPFAGIRWDIAINVKVLTLDHLIEIYGQPAFCKIDVEGYEDKVLNGLSSPIQVLSFEYLPVTRDIAIRCIERLASLGNYRFNRTIGEDRRFQLSQWISQQEMKTWLEACPPSERSGDIYAQLC